jgi:hypothetical protein
VKEALLDILNNIGKMEIAPRKPWIKLNDQLRRETDRAKEVYMEEIHKEIMDFHKKDSYDLMYQKVQ